MAVERERAAIVVALLMAACGVRDAPACVEPGENLVSHRQGVRRRLPRRPPANDIATPTASRWTSDLVIPDMRRARCRSRRSTPDAARDATRPGGPSCRPTGRAFIWPVDGRAGRLVERSAARGATPSRRHRHRARRSARRVRAARDGRVIYSDELRGYGNLIIIEHGDGFATVYAHNRTNRVPTGRRRPAGRRRRRRRRAPATRRGRTCTSRCARTTSRAIPSSICRRAAARRARSTDAMTDLKRLIRDIPDFPKPGIVFKDITPLLADAAAFRATIDALAEPLPRHGRHRCSASSRAASSSARRWRYALGTGIALVRKPGKLPFADVSRELRARVRHRHARDPPRRRRRRAPRAPGRRPARDRRHGDRRRSSSSQRCGGEVVACAFVIELAFLGGRDAARAAHEVHSARRATTA